jgi:hypothetical protein
MPVTKRLRYEVLRRDNHACRYCGANAGKSSVAPDADLVADVDQDAVRWARAVRAAGELMALEMVNMNQRIGVLSEWWDDLADDAYPWNPGALDPPADADDTLASFLSQGIPHAVIADMMEVTMRRVKLRDGRRVYPSDAWRYFCGCCRNKLRDLQDSAQALLKEEG